MSRLNFLNLMSECLCSYKISAEIFKGDISATYSQLLWQKKFFMGVGGLEGGIEAGRGEGESKKEGDDVAEWMNTGL